MSVLGFTSDSYFKSIVVRNTTNWVVGQLSYCRKNVKKDRPVGHNSFPCKCGGEFQKFPI